LEGERMRKEYVLSEPRDIELWQTVKALGHGCKVHKSGLDLITFYAGKNYCPFSEWYEKKDCSFVPGYEVDCKLCGASVTRGYCKGHKKILDTKDAVVLSVLRWHEMDHGYGYTTEELHVFSKAGDGAWKVSVDTKDGWREKTLAHIKANGFKADREILA
jgi:hypothetical protein